MKLISASHLGFFANLVIKSIGTPENPTGSINAKAGARREPLLSTLVRMLFSASAKVSLIILVDAPVGSGCWLMNAATSRSRWRARSERSSTKTKRIPALRASGEDAHVRPRHPKQRSESLVHRPDSVLGRQRSRIP